MDTGEIRRFYDASTQCEWERLERRPYEFAINMHFIERYVRPGQTVLDIGGGPAVYGAGVHHRAV